MLGDFLRTLRQRRGLSQAEVAERGQNLGGTGFFQTALSAWEAGNRRPDARQLSILLDVLDASNAEKVEAINAARDVAIMSGSSDAA